MMSKSLLALATLAGALPSASAIRWSVGSVGCGDGSPVSNLKVSITCDGSSACDLGDTATIQGTAYAKSSFEDQGVTLKACLSGYCPEAAQKGAGTLCGDWLSPSEGQECGESGSYDVYHTEEIPSSAEAENLPSALSWLLRRTVTVKMSVGDEGGCSGEADNAYSMSYSMAGFASVALVGTAWYLRKRRSRGDDDEKVSRFVEMGEMGGFDIAVV